MTMKRILISIASLAALCFTAAAQQKGEQSLGLHLGYDTGVTGYKFYVFGMGTQETKTNNGYNLASALEYSYFVCDNLRISANVAYGFQGNPETPSSTHSITIAPGIAYYVRLADNFYYTPNLNVGFACGVTGSGTLGRDWELMTMYGLGAELQPLAVEFRPTKKFAMSVSLCSLQGVAMEGKYDFAGGNGINMSGMGVRFDLISNAQVGFKLYF